jgi:hypothetical protein
MSRLVKRLIVPTLLMMSVMVSSCDSQSRNYSSPPMHASDFKEMADEMSRQSGIPVHVCYPERKSSFFRTKIWGAKCSDSTSDTMLYPCPDKLSYFVPGEKSYCVL